MSLYLSQKIKLLSLLAMIMVVVVHAYNLPERYLHPATMVQVSRTLNSFEQLFLANGFTRFAIPLFFLISGYLNFPKPGRTYAEAVRKRSRTVLLPYFLWSALGLLVFWAAEHHDLLWQAIQKGAIGAFSDTKVSDYSPGQLLYRWAVEPVPFQLWFLRCLFVYSLLVPLLLGGLERAAPVILSLFGLMWFFNIGLYFVEGEGLLFFSLGLWLRQRETDVQQAPAWFRWKWVAAAWLALLLFKTWFAFGEYNTFWPVVQIFCYRMAQPLGVLSIWFGYDRLMRGRLPARGWLRASDYTFIIYGLHVPFLNILTDALFLRYGETDATRAWVYWTVLGTTLAVCFITGALLKRFARPVFGWLTGDRGMD